MIRTETCNKCHDQLAFHGGSRSGMELCIMCHTPQTVDPDTGNTLDMKVFVHKLHMGEELPSVKAGNAVPDYRLQPGGFGLVHGRPAVRPAALRVLPRAHREDRRDAGGCTG